MDRFSKHLSNAAAARGQPSELELRSTLHLAGGATQVVSDIRRGLCKKVSRKRNSTVFEYADIDRSPLEQTFPFETFKVSDFAELFVDHVGRVVSQGVGTVRKVPMSYVQKTGAFVYAGPKVLAGTPATLLAVYRGTADGQGSVVSSSEYTATTVVGVSVGTLNAISFAREQVDFSGRPYIIEADWLLPGTRSPSSEVSRILQAFGMAVDSTSFTAAAAADAAAGFLMDGLYMGRAGSAILEDLLQLARGWLSQTATGTWAIVQDVAKASVLQMDTSIDLIDIQDYGDPDLVATVSLEYRPKRSATEEYANKLIRSAGGASGEKQLKNPYIGDHTVADRLLSYWQKRLGKSVGSANVFAQQLLGGSVLTVTDQVYWRGAKDLIITGISRPADLNAVKLREYDAALYTYVPGALPADATNTYSPDYSFTAPLAPTSPTRVASGVSADNDGKQTAWEQVRVTPPAANWSSLWAQLTDTTTNEQYTQQLFLTGGHYDAVVGGLRPGRVHSILFWARNAAGLDGATATYANFTTGSAAIALSAPAIAVSQKQSFFVDIDMGAVTDVAGQPKFRRYVLFEKVGAGSFSEVLRTADRVVKRQVVHLTAYQYKAHAEDLIGNETADSNTVSITPNSQIDDNHIVTSGVSGTSIASASINQGRQKTSTASQSGSVGGNNFGSVGGGSSTDYSFAPGICAGGSGQVIATMALLLGPSSTQWIFYVKNNDPASIPYDATWKQVTT